nr:MAG TPA: Protein of unknown function (DUF2634) [Caudoviricetes sp.]
MERYDYGSEFHCKSKVRGNMDSLKIDADNNLVLIQGNLVIAVGIAACAQDTRTRIGFVKGENPYDTAAGTDYFSTILGKMGGIDYIREQIRSRIMDNNEITQINNLALTYEDGVLNLAAKISTIYGNISL